MTFGESDIREVCRYLGYGKAQPDSRTLDKIMKVGAEYARQAEERWVMRPYDISAADSAVDIYMPDGRRAARLNSSSLARTLAGCGKAVLFAATLGAGCDRLMARYGAEDITSAAIAQSAGACLIERLCDSICGKIAEENPGLFPVRRFSPGYGDLALETQRVFADLLDCGRAIGLTFTDTMMMIPTKSVTAIVGLSVTERSCSGGCPECGRKECEYRSE